MADNDEREQDDEHAWKRYAAAAIMAALFGVGLLLLLVYRGADLVQGSADGKVFYIVLVFFGLSCAAFLFGVLRSYAALQHSQMGTTLKLGGPVVVLVLVVVGGFWLVPRPIETFDLTVRPLSTKAGTAVIVSGRIMIDFGTRRDTVDLDARGEANFKSIPVAFRTATVRVLAKVEGFEEVWSEVPDYSDVSSHR
jgi:hypothetical protein